MGLCSVQIRTRDGRAVRLLTVFDEYTRECLAIRAGRSIRSSDVIETLAELLTVQEVPGHIRLDNVLTAVSSSWLESPGFFNCRKGRLGCWIIR